MGDKKLGFVGEFIKDNVITDKDIEKLRQIWNTEPVAAKKEEVERIIDAAVVISAFTEFIISHWSDKMAHDKKIKALIGEIMINKVNAMNVLRGSL